MLVSGPTGFAELDTDFDDGAVLLYLAAPLPLSEPLPDEPIDVLLRVLPRIGPAPLSIGCVAGAEPTLLVTGAMAAGLTGSVWVGPLK